MMFTKFSNTTPHNCPVPNPQIPKPGAVTLMQWCMVGHRATHQSHFWKDIYWLLVVDNLLLNHVG